MQYYSAYKTGKSSRAICKTVYNTVSYALIAVRIRYARAWAQAWSWQLAWQVVLRQLGVDIEVVDDVALAEEDDALADGAHQEGEEVESHSGAVHARPLQLVGWGRVAGSEQPTKATIGVGERTAAGRSHAVERNPKP